MSSTAQSPLRVAANTFIYGNGADTSIFRQLPFVVRVARIGVRALPFALPAGIAVAWAAYPALDPAWKKEKGIP